MQLYGEKEYIVFSPEQTGSCTRRTACGNKSRIDDLLHPDLAAFPLFDQAEGVRFPLHPGETLFVPAGWWHTARILSPSVTVSINGVNRANARRSGATIATHRTRSALLGFVARQGCFSARRPACLSARDRGDPPRPEVPDAVLEDA